MIRRRLIPAFAALCLAQLGAPARAQTAQGGQYGAIRRTILQRADIPGAPALEQVMGETLVPPGAASSRHFHHGTEITHVLEGHGTLAIDGEAPRMLKAGDSFFIPAKKIHNFTADITGPTRVLAVWVVEKGKPLAERVS